MPLRWEPKQASSAVTLNQLRRQGAQLMQRAESLDNQLDTLGKTVETMGKAVEAMGRKINRDQTLIEKLTHEIAQLKRLKFAKCSEQMNPEQASLLDDLINTDIAAIEAEFQALQTVLATTEKKQKPKRTALPAEFPRTLIHHEPDSTYCPCGCALKRIGKGIPTAVLLAHVMVAKFADHLPLYLQGKIFGRTG